VNHYLVMTVASTFAPNKKHGVALSDWSDCETKRLEMNHEAKMAISRAIEDDEGMADRSHPGGYLPSYFDKSSSNMQTELVQLLQGKIDWSINKGRGALPGKAGLVDVVSWVDDVDDSQAGPVDVKSWVNDK
ncbi:hypothetical protein THAOC_16610, partial [Thalassiosira oceanica]